MSAGTLRERLTFSKRTETADDGYGNTEQGWTEQFTVAARVRPRLGGEEVTAARLQGRNIVAVTVRAFAGTREITPDWRAVDARTGVEYNIRTAVLTEDRAYIEMLAEKGVAV